MVAINVLTMFKANKYTYFLISDPRIVSSPVIKNFEHVPTVNTIKSSRTDVNAPKRQMREKNIA